MATNSTSNLNLIAVVLKFPKKLNDYIVYVKAIYKSMLANVYFPASAPKLVTLENLIVILDGSVLGCSTNPKTVSIAKRNTDKVAVTKQVRSLKADVQVVVDANPLIATVIIKSASMKEGIVTPRGKRQNTAVNGTVPNTVYATGAGVGPHQWRISTDGTNWTVLEPTKKGVKIIDDLIGGLVYEIQNALIPEDGEKTVWSASVKVRVT